MMMDKCKCFVCEKDMSYQGESTSAAVYAGGTAEVTFGYGSRKFDLAADPEGTRAEKLLACSKVVGYICDECFENKSHLFTGWNKSKEAHRYDLCIENT